MGARLGTPYRRYATTYHSIGEADKAKQKDGVVPVVCERGVRDVNGVEDG